MIWLKPCTVLASVYANVTFLASIRVEENLTLPRYLAFLTYLPHHLKRLLALSLPQLCCCQPFSFLVVMCWTVPYVELFGELSHRYWLYFEGWNAFGLSVRYWLRSAFMHNSGKTLSYSLL